MIIVVVGGNARDDLDPFLCSSFFYFGYIIWVNCGRFLGNFVDEKVCVVVASDGDGDDLHVSRCGGRKEPVRAQEGTCLCECRAERHANVHVRGSGSSMTEQEESMMQA